MADPCTHPRFAVAHNDPNVWRQVARCLACGARIVVGRIVGGGGYAAEEPGGLTFRETPRAPARTMAELLAEAGLDAAAQAACDAAGVGRRATAIELDWPTDPHTLAEMLAWDEDEDEGTE